MNASITFWFVVNLNNLCTKDRIYTVTKLDYVSMQQLHFRLVHYMNLFFKLFFCDSRYKILIKLSGTEILWICVLLFISTTFSLKNWIFQLNIIICGHYRANRQINTNLSRERFPGAFDVHWKGVIYEECWHGQSWK